VLVLYSLTSTLLPETQRHSVPVVAALLHIVSPAGVFLSAPYGESLFALLSFVGIKLLFEGIGSSHDHRTYAQDVYIILAGAVFGLSCTVRSNGIFSGLLIAANFISAFMALCHNVASFDNWRKSTALVIAGVLVGIGFVMPQAIAFYDICMKTDSATWPRAWCGSTFFPSVYTWVQSHYW
jgi:GPI mannosyltransferase 2